MKSIDVIMVRIYITESSHVLNDIMKYLQEEAKIRGVTVFRAINGFGDSGHHHTSSLLTVSLSLPLTIEFFDSQSKIEPALAYLSHMIKEEHIVYWDAKANV